MNLTPTNVPAIEWRTEYGIACGPGSCRPGPIETPVYPPSPRGEELRALRQARGISPRRAAQQLGIDAVIIYDLELGRATLPDEQWAEPLDWMRGQEGSSHP